MPDQIRHLVGDLPPVRSHRFRRNAASQLAIFDLRLRVRCSFTTYPWDQVPAERFEAPACEAGGCDSVQASRMVAVQGRSSESGGVRFIQFSRRSSILMSDSYLVTEISKVFPCLSIVSEMSWSPIVDSSFSSSAGVRMSWPLAPTITSEIRMLAKKARDWSSTAKT